MSKKLFVVLGIVASSLGAMAQGCSDAGVCTLDAIRPHAEDSMKLQNKLVIGANYGFADHSIHTFGGYLEYARSLNSGASFNIKVTQLAQFGHVQTLGLSDVYLTYSQRVRGAIKFIGGVKIPLQRADKALDGLPLPMDHQSSLGTYDLIAGLAFSKNSWNGALLLQQPFIQNQNEFLSSAYPSDHPFASYQSTNGFERRGDIVVRVNRQFRTEKDFSINPGLLAIYHLGEDKYVDLLEKHGTISGSEGLTLNANFSMQYKLPNHHALQFDLGFPFVVRESRPDGLTRAVATNLQYAIRF